MSETRHLKVHFNDGTLLHFELPTREEGSLADTQRAESILEKRHLVVETDGTLLMLPVTSIKYVEIYPSPRNLPGAVIRGARLLRPDA